MLDRLYEREGPNVERRLDCRRAPERAAGASAPSRGLALSARLARAIRIYLVLASPALVFQLVLRLAQCSSAGACAAAAAKALLWSLLWPAYWALYAGLIHGPTLLALLLVVGIAVPYCFVALGALSFLLRPFQWLADGRLRSWLGRHLSALVAAALASAVIAIVLALVLNTFGLRTAGDWRIAAGLLVVNMTLIELDLYARVEDFRRSLWYG